MAETATEEDPPLCKAFVALMELHEAEGRPSLKETGGRGEYTAGPWRVVINGTAEKNAEGIPPFCSVAYYKGSDFPAMIFSPNGGEQLAARPGEESAESSLIAALEEATAKAKGAPLSVPR
jgi:hypothetical protein